MSESPTPSRGEVVGSVFAILAVIAITAFGIVAMLGLLVFYATVISAVTVVLFHDAGFFQILQGNLAAFETMTGLNLPLWFYGFALIVYSPLFIMAMWMFRHRSSNASFGEQKEDG